MYLIINQRLNEQTVTDPSSNEMIFLSSPHMSHEGYEIDYIQQAFESNWIAPMGENVDAFETELAAMVNSRSAVALTSGTAAIHMALKAAGVGPGDVVFCPTLTFSATANPILYEQAVPVFIDSDETTWNMCPISLQKAFKKYPHVKAVIVVHLYGLSADMDPILDICRQYEVPVIEDAAESLGATYKGQQSGTLGDYGIYSFNGNKIITTSGGGMLVSDNAERIGKVRFWATQSKDSAPYYEHSELGFNYRMSNVVAGIGRGQLHVLQQRIAKKKYIFEYYQKHLSNIHGIEFMPINDWNEPNYWLSAIKLTGNIKPSQLIETLKQHNIESRHIWKPMHLQPFFKQYDFLGMDVAEHLFETGICLPSDTKMTDAHLARVVSTIQKVMGNVNATI